LSEREEMRVLRGVVYMMKSRGPRTKHWGTPQEEVHKDEKVLLHLTQKERDDKGLKPVEDRAMDTEPRGETSE